MSSRIATLSATPPALIASDSVTHGKPDQWDVYETIDGQSYSLYKFANATISRRPAADAAAATPGRMRHFPDSLRAIRAKAAELATLRARR